MPLVLEPGAYSTEQLTNLARELEDGLRETRELVATPKRPVRDPASLRTALDLVDAVLAATETGERDAARRLAAQSNLLYAAMLAAIDLVKSHTDGPTVPRSSRSA
jgi:hypothetical protein